MGFMRIVSMRWFFIRIVSVWWFFVWFFSMRWFLYIFLLKYFKLFLIWKGVMCMFRGLYDGFLSNLLVCNGFLYRLLVCVSFFIETISMWWFLCILQLLKIFLVWKGVMCMFGKRVKICEFCRYAFLKWF